jgi:nucleotide-binding universal stress UspA family protein
VTVLGRFRSLLVPVDLSPSSDRVLARVALLPLADDAHITLLHVIPDDLSWSQQRNAERDARKALIGEARHLAQLLGRKARVEPLVSAGATATEIAAHGRAVQAELIVMGRSGGRPVRDALLGSTAERVVRRGELPVLVVRLPARQAYLRPALALDIDAACNDIVSTLLRVLTARSSLVTIIHAVNDPYRGMVYSGLSEEEVADRKEQLHQDAGVRLRQQLAASVAGANILPSDAPLWKTQIRHGSPRTVIEKAVRKAETDLLVLGTHAHTGVAYMLLGTVAGDVLRRVPCDVLVVPPAPTAPSAS